MKDKRVFFITIALRKAMEIGKKKYAYKPSARIITQEKPLGGKMKTSGYERAWLQYIADIAYDRDGYHNANDLGELVDELRSFAIQALKGEAAPIPDEAVTTKLKRSV